MIRYIMIAGQAAGEFGSGECTFDGRQFSRQPVQHGSRPGRQATVEAVTNMVCRCSSSKAILLIDIKNEDF